MSVLCLWMNEVRRMIANVINAAAILLGGLLGLLIGSRMPERASKLIMQGLALCVCVIGLRMALGTSDILLLMLSVALGGALGELINIEAGLERLGNWMQKRFASAGRFSEAFVTATLLYCVGSLAITGAIAAGLQGDYTLLYSKAVIDGVTSITFAASMGVGVLFSVIPVLLYQGAITLTASSVASLLGETAVAEMSAAGGVLMLGIALNMLGVTKIKTGNLLPAIFLPLGLLPLLGLLSQWL